MISKEHKKHTALTRPALGNFGRNEWAIIGAPCTVIKRLASEIIHALTPDYKGAYADTTHNDDITLPPGRLGDGALLEYTDQVKYSQLNYVGNLTAFELRNHFSGADYVLINGNHQQAKAQVLILDENKKSSLQKRTAELTNVELILLGTNASELHDVVQKFVPQWQSIPVFNLTDTEQIAAFFKSRLMASTPKLNGLVLAGGKSERMGFDKGAIQWHGKEQRYYAADMLKSYCQQVYISCRPGQAGEIDAAYATLEDTFINLGPYGAILSAMREQPDSAWLVVATDLPLLDETTIQHLISLRNPSAIATAYTSSYDGLPEPLITIWEPKSYPVMLSFLAQGYSCPRKVLINSNTSLLSAANPNALTNVNTPDELERIKTLLHPKISANE